MVTAAAGLRLRSSSGRRDRALFRSHGGGFGSEGAQGISGCVLKRCDDELVVFWLIVQTEGKTSVESVSWEWNYKDGGQAAVKYG